MKVRVIKPIPGTGYHLGDVAEFSQEKTAELLKGKYVESVTEKDAGSSDSKKEKAPKK